LRLKHRLGYDDLALVYNIYAMLANKYTPVEGSFGGRYKTAEIKHPYWTKKRIIFLFLMMYAVAVSVAVPFVVAELFF